MSTLLETVRVGSVVYCRSELGAPWGFRVGASPQAKFHLLLRGRAELTVESAGAVALTAGDLVLLPHGSDHVMRDRAGSRVRHLDGILDEHPVDRTGTLHYGGRGPKTLLVCGAFDIAPTGDLLRWLPKLLVLDTATNGLGRWLDPMLDLVQPEKRTKPGDAAILARVTDVFLTDVLRHYLTNSRLALPTSRGVTDNDPAIAAAVHVIHHRANEPWTITSLAREVGMSRSSFAARFRASTGSSPITYLTRVRLSGAAGTLATSTRPLSEIARAAGYDNESSFSKAFSRAYGQPPGQYRSNHRNGTPG